MASTLVLNLESVNKKEWYITRLQSHSVSFIAIDESSHLTISFYVFGNLLYVTDI